MNKKFTFLDPGKLTDNDLELVLIKKVPANKKKRYFPAYEFEMRNSKTGKKIGGISLRIGNNETTKCGGHIGYRVDEEFRGNRYAARSLKLLFPFAKRNCLNPPWITCNSENIPSRKTCELAGGALIEIVDVAKNNEEYQAGVRKNCRYRFNL